MKQAKPTDEFTRKRMLRQRRIRKRRLMIGFVTFLILLLAVGVVLSLTVLFPIKEIRVTGSGVYTEKQVVNACGITVGENLFTASQKKCEAALRRQLPYIESASLEKEIAGVLTIVVTDAEEYAAYAVGNDYYLVSKSGHVLDRQPDAPKDLVTVITDDAKLAVGEDVTFESQKTGELVDRLMVLAGQNGLTWNTIDLTDDLSITVKTEGRFLVDLGTSNYLENKVKHLAAMIEAVEPEKTGRINLSMWTSANTEGTFVEGSIE